jgi:hypothetical protein
VELRVAAVVDSIDEILGGRVEGAIRGRLAEVLTRLALQPT